jgi:hypothetical protein
MLFIPKGKFNFSYTQLGLNQENKISPQISPVGSFQGQSTAWILRIEN